MIDSDDVFDAIRRGYTELSDASSADILDYFSVIDVSSMSGHVSNIKGIMFEQLVAEGLKEQGLDAELFDKTNHPVSDIMVYDSDCEQLCELQLKATDSVSYVSSALEHNPDVPIITTSEVAEHFDNSLIINSGIENSYLHDAVMNAVFDNDSDLIDKSAEIIGSSFDDTSVTVASDVIGGTVSEGVADSVLGDAVSEGLADSVLEAVTSIPFSPTGLALKLLFALF